MVPWWSWLIRIMMGTISRVSLLTCLISSGPPSSNIKVSWSSSSLPSWRPPTRHSRSHSSPSVSTSSGMIVSLKPTSTRWSIIRVSVHRQIKRDNSTSRSSINTSNHSSMSTRPIKTTSIWCSIRAKRMLVRIGYSPTPGRPWWIHSTTRRHKSGTNPSSRIVWRCTQSATTFGHSPPK